MTAVRPDDTAGTGERADELAATVRDVLMFTLAFTEQQPTRSVYPNAMCEAAMAALDSLVAAVREAEAERDELRAHVESQDWHTEFYAPLKRRAVNAEARAERAERALDHAIRELDNALIAVSKDAP